MNSFPLGLMTMMVIAPTVLVAMWYDIRTRTIPNWVTLPPIIAAPLLAAAHGGWQAGALTLYVGALTFAAYAFLWRLGGIGGGDVKLMTGLAAALGPLALPFHLYTIGAAAAVSVYQMIRQRSRSVTIPYAVPAAMAVIATLASHWAIHWLPSVS